MKKTLFIKFALLLFSLISQSCFYYDSSDDDTFELEPDYQLYDPVVMSREDFESSIKLLPVTPIKKTGKIYVKGSLLFINDYRLGFHIYDNTDPTNPKPITFLQAPGATDIAVRDNTLYLNQATDLIALVYNPDDSSLQITKRIKNTFPEMHSPDGHFPFDLDDNEVVVGWTKYESATLNHQN